MEITHITKRDFSTKPFELYKITNAILKAMTAVDHGQMNDAQNIADQVYQSLLERKTQVTNYVPTVEEVQDIVEQHHIGFNYTDLLITPVDRRWIVKYPQCLRKLRRGISSSPVLAFKY